MATIPGITTRLIDGVRRAVGTIIGEPTALPPRLVERYPELNRARWRRGGLPVRVGGWCLGQRSVAAITLWRTIWLASDVLPDAELLLHELRHVDQFEADATFPIRYLWESVTRGYVGNRFEVDARRYAAIRVNEQHGSNS
jgi:hypothetical protein